MKRDISANQMKRHVIIVTHNNEKHIRTCLDALPAAWAGRPYHVTVVDNASRDATVTLIQRAYPNVRVISLSTNIGFARAVHRAYTPEAALTLLLNPDTVPTPHSLARLENALHRWPRAGAVGPALITPKGNVDPRSARAFPSLWREGMDKLGLTDHYPGSRITGRYSMGTVQISGPVPVLSGASMLIRREAWSAVGGLDTNFWLYAEDTDFCTRLWKAGWMCVYHPQARVFHLGGGSSASEHRLTLGLTAIDSMYRYFVKHRGQVYGLMYRGLMLGIAGLKSIYWGIRGDIFHLRVQWAIVRWAWTRAHRR